MTIYGLPIDHVAGGGQLNRIFHHMTHDWIEEIIRRIIEIQIIFHFNHIFTLFMDMQLSRKKATKRIKDALSIKKQNMPLFIKKQYVNPD